MSEPQQELERAIAAMTADSPEIWLIAYVDPATGDLHVFSRVYHPDVPVMVGGVLQAIIASALADAKTEVLAAAAAEASEKPRIETGN